MNQSSRHGNPNIVRCLKQLSFIILVTLLLFNQELPLAYHSSKRLCGNHNQRSTQSSPTRRLLFCGEWRRTLLRR